MVHLLDALTGRELAALDSGVYVDVVAFAPDGTTLAAAGVEWQPGTKAERVLPRVTILDVKTGKKVRSDTGTIGTLNRGGHLLSGSADGSLWALSKTSEKGVIVWDPVAGKEEIVLRDKQECHAAFAPDGKTLAVLHTGGDRKLVLSLLQRGK